MSPQPTEAAQAQRPDLSLPELEKLARRNGSIALDTEFVGEGRYRTLLCLVQVAVSDDVDGLCTALADPLSDDLDVAPLAALLADPDIEVVVHAGRQDVALLRRRFATEVSAIFDTQIAAGFAGYLAQSSYHALLNEVLGVHLKKSASFTRWETRPLTDEQLAYAREDVIHLLELAAELKRRLRSAGRLDWALQECRSLESASDERDLESVLSRLPRIHSLSVSSQAVARQLVAWREEVAIAQDRPVQSVLADAGLMELAKRKPSSLQQLRDIRGVPPGGIRRRGHDILNAIRQGAESPTEPLERERRPPTPNPGDATLVALMEALARARTREAGLAYELVASRSDLQAIIDGRRVDGGRPDVRTLSGWRRELVGEELLALLDGRVSLSVRDAALRVGELPDRD